MLRCVFSMKLPRRRYLTRALFGTEIAVEVAVHHGVTSLVDFRAGFQMCNGKMGVCVCVCVCVQ